MFSSCNLFNIIIFEHISTTRLVAKAMKLPGNSRKFIINTFLSDLRCKLFKPPFLYCVNTIRLFFCFFLYVSFYGVTLSSKYLCSAAYRTCFPTRYKNEEYEHNIPVLDYHVPYTSLISNN